MFFLILKNILMLKENCMVITKNSQRSLRNQFFKKQYKVSLFRKIQMMNLQVFYLNEFVPKNKGLSKKEKSKKIRMNLSYSEGIILIMKSEAQKRSALMRNYLSIYHLLGSGVESALFFKLIPAMT